MRRRRTQRLDRKRNENTRLQRKKTTEKSRALVSDAADNDRTVGMFHVAIVDRDIWAYGWVYVRDTRLD